MPASPAWPIRKRVMSRADDAQQLLDNPVFQDALRNFRASLIEEISQADPTDRDRHQALVIGLQQAERLQAAIQSFVDDERLALHNETMAKAIS